MAKQKTEPDRQSVDKITPTVAFEYNGQIFKSRIDAAKARCSNELGAFIDPMVKEYLIGRPLSITPDGIIEHKTRIMEILTWLTEQEKLEE